jgi:hypothetical protein
MNYIKRIAVFLFVVGITFPAEATHAFTFIPDFIDHYNHHNDEHHKLSFVDFVIEHTYGGHDEEKGQHPQDECPIQHNHLQPVQNVSFFEDYKFKIVDFTRVVRSESSTPLPEYTFCNSEYIANIWQPPKIG